VTSESFSELRFRPWLPSARTWFGGLVFKAHRWLYHSTLGSRVIKKKKFGFGLMDLGLGVGVGVEGAGCRVWGSGFRVEGLGCTAEASVDRYLIVRRGADTGVPRS